jgi:hypothetical protein
VARIREAAVAVSERWTGQMGFGAAFGPRAAEAVRERAVTPRPAS